MTDSYPIVDVDPRWVLEPEALGSKKKFWYRSDVKEREWLFKYSQPNTGQHWAEKVAAEVGRVLGITCAEVELAAFVGERGSTTRTFATGGLQLFHGNQLLAGCLDEYDPTRRFRQSSHTLANIMLCLKTVFADEHGAALNQQRFASYLILDALIGNTDRHHENWGVLVRQSGDERRGALAPSFDHASSLGRELLDEHKASRGSESSTAEDSLVTWSRGAEVSSTHPLTPVG